jgi:hypothetical protein
MGSRLRRRHNGSNAARQAKVCFCPRLEALEERWAPAIYNNAAQWSAIDNPNGVWSYGYLAPSSTPAMPDASTFKLYTEQVQVPVTSGFIGDWRIPGQDGPNAVYNPLDEIVSVGTITWQPRQASFHPGPNGEYSSYRFTAPTAGDYSLSATFNSIDTVGGADKDIHILVDGSELYDDALSGSYGSTKTFSNAVSLAKGDQVDFVIGFGTGPYFFDTTALDATLMSAPSTPSTSISLSGPAGSNGWYIGPVTVTLAATDPDVPPGSLTTYFSIDGGAIQQYSVPFSIATDGQHVVTFFSKDPSGNVESTHTQTVNIDQTAPQLTGAANTTSLWPPNGKLVPVTITGRITDSRSGVDPSKVGFSVTDSLGQVHPSGPITLNTDGTFSFTVLLEAKGQDQDGRTYTLVISGQDQAGNLSTTSIVIVVPHDQSNTFAWTQEKLVAELDPRWDNAAPVFPNAPLEAAGLRSLSATSSI